VTRICLASASPRRKELLERVGLTLDVVPADVDETVAAGEAPLAYARRVSAAKVHRVAAARAGQAVLGADTIVVSDDGGPPILGKAADAAEAQSMLTRLSGRTHRVITAYHIVAGDAERSRAVETEVTFRPLEPAELAGYVASREWEGKAGAYAVQGIAAAFVRGIRGSYTNVVGLPLCEVIEDLRALHVLPAVWSLGPAGA
jgi:septum formation protein